MLADVDVAAIPMEYPVDEEPIVPCDCGEWCVQVVLEHPTLDGVWVREWHALNCRVLAWWLEGITEVQQP